jgi:F-type H+-transporting ATPase subunit gamma
MASIRVIKRRIKSAKNIGQVTRALQMVSAVKMRKAQEVAVAGKPYAAELISVLAALSGKVETDIHPFLNPLAEISQVYVVVIGPEKGLAGSLITNLAKKVFFTIDGIKNYYKNAKISTISFGKKSRDILRKTGVPLIADFTIKPKETAQDQVEALSSFLTGAYLRHEADLVIIVYSNYINTITQSPTDFQFLPMVSFKATDSSQPSQVFNFEPSPAQVMEVLLKHYLETVLRQIILDSQAAEHSARMVAMKNASDNAIDIVKSLTLNYNQTRQTAITNEIADIVSGAMVGA